MMRSLVVACILFISTGIQVFSQNVRKEIFTSPEKSGGVNYAYPFSPDNATFSPPSGYRPFYISHFGRHGSRYLVSDNDYSKVLEVFESAEREGNLTELGKDVHQRLIRIWKSVEGKGGTLTPLGMAQMEEIAGRIVQEYPEVFSNNGTYTAVSTTVGRCIHSMKLFSEKIMNMNKGLYIKQDADEKHMQYLNFHTQQAVNFRYAADTWKEEYKLFEKEHVKPQRILKSLFLEADSATKNLEPAAFMFGLFAIAGNLQNTDLNISLYDIFEKKELFNLWQCKNYSLYVQYANAAINKGIMMENAMPLLEDILKKADEAINSKSKGASFRFGHDGNIIPLAMLLHVENTYESVSNPNRYFKYWNDYRVAPMAANIQMIFYRNEELDDIRVKFLYNEKVVSIPVIAGKEFPFYKWDDVKRFYSSLLKNRKFEPSKSDKQ
ncbi:MAG TPA: histidine-type phosphatase [Lacibacter sp.]|nr:histidine-type phosphatase [Lacibacter sp.]HMO89852.1 histidine-type phosphatase [Lacibacter sp.]